MSYCDLWNSLLDCLVSKQLSKDNLRENMQLVLARENMQSVLSAGKHATGAKRGKNMQPVPSAGKHATGAKRGKNMQPALSAGKHATGGAKTRKQV